MISKNLKKRINTSLFLFILVLLIFSFDFMLIYFLIVLGVLSILEFIEISKKAVILEKDEEFVRAFSILERLKGSDTKLYEFYTRPTVPGVFKQK